METPIDQKKPSSKSYWTKFQFLSRTASRNKRLFRLTRGGWIFILYTIGIGAGAINTGNNLLYLIFGLFLGMILSSGVLSDLTLWRVSVDLTAPISGYAGESLYFPVRLRNSKKWFPSLSVQVQVEGRLQGQPLNGQAFCPSIGKNGEASTLLLLHPRTRGSFEVQAVKISTRFPFGLLNKSWMVRYAPTEILIYPALVPIESMPSPSLREYPEEVIDIQRKGEGESLYGVREYRSSDNPKRIHWKASAKRAAGAQGGGGEHWLVKEMELEGDERVSLQWPEPTYFINWSSEEKEVFVSFAASLVSGYEKEMKRPVLLVHQKGTALEIEGDLLWRFLSTVELDNVAKPEQRLGPTDVHLSESFERWKSRHAA